MHLFMGALLSLAMIFTPFAFQVNISQPPTNMTGWFMFALSLSGILSLVSLVMTKLVINPAIMKKMEDIPSRLEFRLHEEKDEQLRERFEEFVENYWNRGGDEHRHDARRKGDPR